jgi:hypothetical protein
MTHALQIQEGGSHYKSMGIQPIEFCYVNNYDSAAFSVLKYVSRHRSKNRLEDLKKGRHFVQLRRDLRRDNPELFLFKALNVIPISDYIRANSLTGLEAGILEDLHRWALGETSLPDATVADFLIQKFDLLIENAYPQNKD